MPNWQIAFGMVLKKFLRKELIFYLQELVRNRRYTLTVHLEACASVVCITSQLNHFILAVLSKLNDFNGNLLVDYNCELILYLSGFNEHQLYRIQLSRFFVWATSSTNPNPDKDSQWEGVGGCKDSGNVESLMSQVVK